MGVILWAILLPTPRMQGNTLSFSNDNYDDGNDSSFYKILLQGNVFSLTPIFINLAMFIMC